LEEWPVSISFVPSFVKFGPLFQKLKRRHTESMVILYTYFLPTNMSYPKRLESSKACSLEKQNSTTGVAYHLHYC